MGSGLCNWEFRRGSALSSSGEHDWGLALHVARVDGEAFPPPLVAFRERRLGPSVPKAMPRGPPVIEMIAGRAREKRQALATPAATGPNRANMALPNTPKARGRLARPLGSQVRFSGGGLAPNLRPLIHSTLRLPGQVRGPAPSDSACVQKDGGQGGVVEARLAEIDIDKAPDIAISRKNHARLCLRARHHGGEHEHRLSGI